MGEVRKEDLSVRGLLRLNGTSRGAGRAAWYMISAWILWALPEEPLGLGRLTESDVSCCLLRPDTYAQTSRRRQGCVNVRTQQRQN